MKAEILEKENLDIVTKLTMKEQELDRRTQEKVSEFVRKFHSFQFILFYKRIPLLSVTLLHRKI